MMINARLARDRYIAGAVTIIVDLCHIYDLASLIRSYLEAVFPEPD